MKNVLLVGANGRTAREIMTRLLEQDDVRFFLFLRTQAACSVFEATACRPSRATRQRPPI